jgi:hypothetical protein
MVIWQTIVEFLVRDVSVWGELKSPMLIWLGSIGLVMFFGWHVTRLFMEVSRATEPIVRLRQQLVPIAREVEASDLRWAFDRAFSDNHGVTVSDAQYTPGETDLDRLTALDRAMREVGAFRRPWVQFRKTLLIERVPWCKEPRIFSTRRAEDFFTQDAMLAGRVDLSFYGQIPSLITGLGLLLTFVAIYIGLSRLHSDGQSITGLQGLINGLSGKFLASIVGLVCANVFVLLERPAVHNLLASHGEFLTLLDESFPRRTVEDLLDELRRGRAGHETANRVADEIQARLTAPIEALTAAVRTLAGLMQEPEAGAPVRRAAGSTQFLPAQGGSRPSRPGLPSREAPTLEWHP